MAQRSTGKAKGGASKEEGVLGSLPATRPSRLGRRSRSDAEQSADARPQRAAAASKPARKAQPKAREKAQPKATPRSTSAAGSKPAARAAATPAVRSKPRPVRAGAPALKEPAAKAEDQRPVEPVPERSGPSGAELATTVVKAAGELAQIGLTVGGQILKRAADRLPKR